MNNEKDIKETGSLEDHLPKGNAINSDPIEVIEGEDSTIPKFDPNMEQPKKPTSEVKTIKDLEYDNQGLLKDGQTFELNGSVKTTSEVNVTHDSLLKFATQTAKETEDINEELTNLVNNGGLNDTTETTDSLDTLFDEIMEEGDEAIQGYNDVESLEELYNKMEESKAVLVIDENEENIVGPANYTIVNNDEYREVIDNAIVDLHNIKELRSTNKGRRNEDLARFINSGTMVSCALVNSGLAITSSGAGAVELIAMMNISSDNNAMNELGRLSHVHGHITNTSIGKINLKTLTKVTSMYDKDTLFYALYAGTNPKDNVIGRTCENTKCQGETNMTVPTSSLLLNASAFDKETNYIFNEMETVSDLLKVSKLDTVIRKQHSSGIIVNIVHPSIHRSMYVTNTLNADVMRTYPHIIESMFAIDSIMIPSMESPGYYHTIKDPNEITKYLARVLGGSELWELRKLILEMKPHDIPVYGLPEYVCPHCGHLNPEQAFPIEHLLFMLAQKEMEIEDFKFMMEKEKEEKLKESK